MPRLVDHEERRAHLLTALRRIVDRDGAAAISIRTVAAEAQVSKSAIAHYFPSRLSLLAGAAEQMNGEVRAKLRRLDLDDGALSTAVEAVMAAIPDSRARLNQSEVWLLLISERRTDPAARELAADLDERVRSGVFAALQRWTRSGLAHPSRDLDLEAWRLHALIDGLSLHTLHEPVEYPPSRIREVVTSHLGELAHAAAPRSV